MFYYEIVLEYYFWDIAVFVLHSFILGLKPFYRRLSSSLGTDSTDYYFDLCSELYILFFSSFRYFFLVPCGRWSWLRASIWAYVCDITSYRISYHKLFKSTTTLRNCWLATFKNRISLLATHIHVSKFLQISQLFKVSLEVFCVTKCQVVSETAQLPLEIFPV